MAIVLRGGALNLSFLSDGRLSGFQHTFLCPLDDANREWEREPLSKLPIS